MNIISDNEDANQFIEQAVKVALKATCQRSKCGSVIVKDKIIIGEGFNSPPNGLESQRRCINNKESYHKKITDKTCCIHAEQRAIMDALKRNPTKISGSKLYFIRLNEENKKSFAGNPYCTICSKMALDAGIKEFILMHEDGIKIYNTEEYNSLSYNFKW
ncbi:MAG: deaminase [Nanoarchaeota archaeon]